MRINNNIMAMNTHRQLGMANSMGARSMERLSSGFRINRAGDDAAGLAISEKMRAQIRGLTQASRNAQDGISMVQTAEGALQETQSILQRMRELVVQAANGTATDDDRAEIQKEVNQLSSEINRIGNSTEFNTQKLLDGGADASGVSLSSTEAEGVAAVGAKVNGLNSVSFTSMSTISSSAEVLKIELWDKNASAQATFSIAGDDFSTLWAASDGAKTGATNDDKREALLDILENNLSASAWETGYTAATSVNLADVATLEISEEGIFSIAHNHSGNIASGSAELTVDFRVNGTNTATVDNNFSELLGFGDLTGHTFSADASASITSFAANGIDQTEADIYGTEIMSIGSDKLDWEDFSGKTYTVDFNGTEANVTLAVENANVDSNGKIAVSSLATAFNTALDAVFGSGAVAASITDDPDVEGTDTFFKFVTNTTVPTATNGENQVTDGIKPYLSISGDNLNKILGDYVPGSSASGGTFQTNFQIGANNSQELNISIDDMRGIALGVSSSTSGAEHATTDAKFSIVKDVTNDGEASVEYALDVTTTDNASAAVEAIDEALSSVSSQRSQLGSYQNRLEHTISNLDASSENLQAAESRIRDVDMAQEMMQFTKNNILTQAAQAMLAQANQAPQGVLQLLR